MGNECHRLLEKGLKKCYTCKAIKNLDGFCKDKNGIGGIKNNCKECMKVYRRRHYEKNKGKENACSKEYKDKNKERCRGLRKEWDKKNPEKVKIRRRRYYLENIKDPKYRLENNITNSIRRRVKLNRRDKRLNEVLGYSIQELMNHLESKFKPEMNWDNHGTYWHIDHIRPKSWFKYETTNDPEFKACWSLSNIQPLEASINCSKQNRYEG
jgi:hypothetical protein